MHLRREPDHPELADEDTSEDEFSEVLVIPLVEQDDNQSDTENGWMIAGFGENNENILEVLADSLIPSVSDNEDDTIELASDSESFSSVDDNLSEAFISLENAYLNSNMDGSTADSLEVTISSSQNAGSIIENDGKDCCHCKCEDKILGDIDQVIDAGIDEFTKAQFDKYGPADVTLVAGNVEIPCHKEVIRNCSEYFAAMFSSQMIESTQDRIELKEVEGWLLLKLIKFAYYHTLVLDMKNINEVITSARMLQFHEVTSRCSEFVSENMNVSNCLEMMILSDTLAINGVFNKAVKIALWDAHTVTHSEDFLQISQDALTQYLSHNMLNLSELEVYEALMRWVKYKQDERQQELHTVLRVVRLGLLSESELDSVETSPSVHNNQMCSSMIQEIRKCVVQKDLQSDSVPKVFFQPRHIPHKLLVIGGEFESERDDSVEKLPNFGMYEYDTAAHKFEYVCPTVPLSEQQGDLIGYRCCVLGKDIYMSGGELKLGRNKWYDKLMKYDSFNREWKELGEIPHPRRHHNMVAWGQHLYLIGGFGRHRIMLDSVDRYDTESGEWESMPSLNTAVYSAGVCICDDKLYVIKHNVECFTPKAPRWINIAVPIPFEMGIFNCIPLDDKIYMVGSYIKNLVEFDTQTRALTTLGKFNIASGPAVLCNGVIYVVGGQDTKNVETYNLEKQEFGIACQFPRIVSNHHCFSLPEYPMFRTPGCCSCAM